MKAYSLSCCEEKIGKIGMKLRLVQKRLRSGDCLLGIKRFFASYASLVEDRSKVSENDWSEEWKSERL